MNRQSENRAKLANIDDKVRAFYNQRPYPPPVSDLDDYGLQWDDRARRRADFHLYWPFKSYCEGLNILVAGCGTSQAARHALRNPENRVTGIDVSSTSIEHTEGLKHKYQLDNHINYCTRNRRHKFT